MHIPLLRFEELDSTSTEASRLLEAGEARAPFAVFARKQTAGRGRRGRSWASLEGNLFLTLVLPGEGIDHHTASLVPCYVAGLLAAWLESRFAIRATLKWPNDLLFAGAKLGGILCESSAQGKTWGPVLVGFGLNLVSHPKELGLATSLVEAIGAKADAEDVARSICQWFAERWQAAEIGEAPRAFSRYAIEPGQRWLREDDLASLHVDHGLSDAGALRLGSVSGGEVEELVSARHDFRWLYQRGGKPWPLVVADCGNTAVKLALFADPHGDAHPTKTWTVRFNALSPSVGDALRAELVAIGASAPWAVHGASVNPEGWQRLDAALSPAGLSLIEIPKRPLRMTRSDYDLGGMGIDRLAAVEGALAERARGSWQGAAVIVSGGTATTIDALDRGGRHLGGLIVPGLEGQLKAMHEQTARLPQLALDAEIARFRAGLTERLANPLGRDTRSAMTVGVLAHTKSLIDEVARSVSGQENEPVTVLVTGGQARWLAPLVGGRLEESLILDGLRAMTLGG